MKYSKKCLETTFAIIFSEYEKWPKTIDISTLLNLSAIEIFVRQERKKDMDVAYADHVIRTAILELEKNGELTYGTVDEFWMV